MPDKDAPYTWSREDLNKIDPAPFVFEGKTYDAYAATQQQRKIERAMRKTKRELIAWNQVLKHCPEESREAVQAEFDALSARLKLQRNLYRQFSKAAGLIEQNERAQEYGFDRSLSAKSTAGARRYERSKTQ